MDTSAIDPKKAFRKCGTCSQAFGFILNREFDHPDPTEERALDPLAGGVLNQGYQCGMLWGSALASGTQAYHLEKDPNKATSMAVEATKQLIDSFVETNSSADCRDITGCDLTSFWGMAKLMFNTLKNGMNNSPCFNMAERWAPEAIKAASGALNEPQIDQVSSCKSCASEVIRKMGGSEEEIIKVAGYAGGLGLSGNACGALAAAIWYKNLQWCQENPDKTPPIFNNKNNKAILEAFYAETGGKMLCEEIAGQTFEDLKDHSNFVKKGGCASIIEALAES